MFHNSRVHNNTIKKNNKKNCKKAKCRQKKKPLFQRLFLKFLGKFAQGIALAVLTLLAGCGAADSSSLDGASGADAAFHDELIWNSSNEYCKENYVEKGGEIAYVTEHGEIADQGFNETIFGAVMSYAYSADYTYSFYRAASSDEDAHMAAVLEALSYPECELVIVTDSAYSKVIGTIQSSYPDISFLIVGATPEDENGQYIAPTSNVHCITYKEEESGYLAGYMAVLEGYRSFGFMGGEQVEGVVDYGYGFMQGVDDAAYDLQISNRIQIYYMYTGTFAPADFIYETACSWYNDGCEVIFSAGGGIYQSILLAAEECDGQMIGVDINQSYLSDRILTSAMKGLDWSVISALDDFFACDGWSELRAGSILDCGISENCASLPYDPWRFQNATPDDYEVLRQNILSGDTSVQNHTATNLDLAIFVAEFDSPIDSLEGEASLSWTHSWEAKTPSDLVEDDPNEQSALPELDKDKQLVTGSEWMDSYRNAVSRFAVTEEGLYEVPTEHLSVSKRTTGEIPFVASQAADYTSDVHCLYDADRAGYVFQARMKQIPQSDDANVYLFALRTWEKEISGEPVSIMKKGHTMETVLPAGPDTQALLYSRFVPALLIDGSYVAISDGKYITNPEVLASNQDTHEMPASKKGILLDPNCIGTEKLSCLNVERGAYNLLFSQLVGESSDPEHYPTITYEFDGRTYLFNSVTVLTYDYLFIALNQSGIHPTVILLNDWNETYPELIHPLSRTKTSSAYYYAMNSEEEDGIRLLEAIASFLAQRYNSAERGLVCEWVIANEINQQKAWNYMNTDDIELYAESFEKTFRIFYNAMRSEVADSKVYFSLDHDWNDNGGHDDHFFNGRQLLYTINKYALRGGNYDWHLAIHPYPDPMTKVNYWKADYDMTQNAPVLTIMNLSSLTEILDKDSFRMRDGSTRPSAITELGFSSYSGEKLQAAAFAYCYYIIEDNPYIESFLMNRQTDSLLEMKSGLALGVYNPDLSPKYSAEVFAGIDQGMDEETLKMLLNILGASSLEEALSWAKP